ncbi:MAG: hypothetical protein EXR77_03430 [Myxococcales bacterium]|nr:hypothetical protein [Myxococcales bacterium]
MATATEMATAAETATATETAIGAGQVVECRVELATGAPRACTMFPGLCKLGATPTDVGKKADSIGVLN